MSDAYFAQDISGNAVSILGGADLLSLTVPAGSYVIVGKAMISRVSGSDDQVVFCEIKANGTQNDRTDAEVPSGIPSLSEATLLSAGTFASTTTITLRCSGQQTVASEFALSATRVGQLH